MLRINIEGVTPEDIQQAFAALAAAGKAAMPHYTIETGPVAQASFTEIEERVTAGRKRKAASKGADIPARVPDSADAAQQSLLAHDGIPGDEVPAGTTEVATEVATEVPAVAPTHEQVTQRVTAYIQAHGADGVAKVAGILKAHFGGRRVRELTPEEVGAFATHLDALA